MPWNVRDGECMGRIKERLGKVFSGKALFRAYSISLLLVAAFVVFPDLESEKRTYEPAQYPSAKFQGRKPGREDKLSLANKPQDTDNFEDQLVEGVEIAQINLPYKNIRISHRTKNKLITELPGNSGIIGEEDAKDIVDKSPAEHHEKPAASEDKGETDIKPGSDKEPQPDKNPSADKEPDKKPDVDKNPEPDEKPGTDHEAGGDKEPGKDEEPGLDVNDRIKELKVNGILRSDYCVGSTVPLDELEVYAVREDDEKILITADQYTVKPYDTSMAGNGELIIEYGGKSVKIAFGVVEYIANLHLNGDMLDTHQLKAYDYTLAPMQEPVREGYVFTGWYLSKDYSEPVDLNAYRMPVGTTEINLYAGWTKESDFVIDANGMLSEYRGSEIPDGGFMELPREGCTGVRSSAFVNSWEGITDLCIPGNITYIEPGALNPLRELWWIFVEGSNPNYAAANGVLFSKDMSTLIYYPVDGSVNYRIPESVTAIENHAMSMVSSRIDKVYFTSLTPPELLLNQEAYFRGLCRSDDAGGAVQLQLYVPAEAEQAYREAFSQYYFSPEDEAGGITLSDYILV